MFGSCDSLLDIARWMYCWETASDYDLFKSVGDHLAFGRSGLGIRLPTRAGPLGVVIGSVLTGRGCAGSLDPR